MTNKLEKQFFDTFGIECNISFHQQFNGAQVPRGLEFYKKREELAKTGIIKIWHKMLNPRPENDCVYWGEYHYPQITDRILLELMELLMKQQATEFYYHNDEYLFSSKLLGSNRPTCNRVNNLRELILRTAICLGGFAPLKEEMLDQVQLLFKEER